MFNKQIKFGDTNVGNGHQTYFIAEIGANFDGSLDKAKKLLGYHPEFSFEKGLDEAVKWYWENL